MNGMFRTNNTPVFRAIYRNMNWLKINNSSVNCLKASTDKVKQPNWNKTNEINSVRMCIKYKGHSKVVTYNILCVIDV